MPYVKIGLASKLQSIRRVKILQTAWPIDLKLLLTIPDVGPTLEMDLQNCFGRAHARGEWFHFDLAIAEFIRRCEPLAEEKRRETLDVVRELLSRGKPKPITQPEV
jgi:hypothetical protein